MGFQKNLYRYIRGLGLSAIVIVRTVQAFGKSFGWFFAASYAMQYGSKPHGGNLGACLLSLHFLVSVLSKVLYGLSAQFRQAFNAVLPELQHSHCSFAGASTQFSRGFNTVFTRASTQFLPVLQLSFDGAST